MRAPIVSYIIVAYKSNATIGEAVKSIITQSGEFTSEIIVIDNYCAESCREIVMAVAPKSKVAMNPSNCGYTQATNQGIKHSSGEYVFLLNPDVLLKPNCTQNLIMSLSRKSDWVAASAPQLLNDDGSIQGSVRNFPTFSTLVYEHLGLSRLFRRSCHFNRWRNPGFDYSARSSVNQPMASALLIRKDVLEILGDWDERYFVFFSDVDYCRRIIDAGYNIIFEPGAKATHQVGGSTRQEGAWLIYDSHRGFYRYLVKHELKGVKALLRPLAAFILSLSAVLRAGLRGARYVPGSRHG